MNTYTEEEIKFMLGCTAFFIIGGPYILDELDVINARSNYLPYLRNIPYLDQIKTKRLFKLIMLAK